MPHEDDDLFTGFDPGGLTEFIEGGGGNGDDSLGMTLFWDGGPPVALDVPLQVSLSDVVREFDAGRSSEPIVTTISDRLRDVAAGIPSEPANDTVAVGTPDWAGIGDFWKSTREVTREAVGFLGDVASLVGVTRKTLGLPTTTQTVAPPRTDFGGFIQNLFGGQGGGGGLMAPSPVGGVPWLLLVGGGAVAWWAWRKR